MKKDLGQNFLVNKKVVKEFIEFCDLNKKDRVLEIGVGGGALTKRVSPRVEKVIGIEIDPHFVNQSTKFSIPNFQIFKEDILKSNLREYINTYKINKIIGAIPYYISSPIIHKIIEESAPPLKEVSLITQFEFAKKLIGEEDKRSYFTNLLEKYANIHKGKKVNKTSFNPVPKVDSFYFKLIFNNYPKNEKEVVKWSRFLHHVYATPRKKINKRFKKETLEKAGIDPNLRPHQLQLEELEKLSNL